MIQIENEYLSLQINKQGAELISVVDKVTNYEFIWQGDDQYWGRSAPVLFPIIGRLKGNQYTYQGKTYQLNRHGFARDLDFYTQNVTEHSASFYLKNSPETFSRYPFEFSFQINYILYERTLTITYEILNPSATETLYYSVGAHPAFNVSKLGEGKNEDFNQVFLQFTPKGQYLELFLDKEGLVQSEKSKYSPLDVFPLSYKDFKKDTLMYQINSQTEVKLIDGYNQSEIILKPRRMDFIALWTPYPKNAPFVSVEAWAGIGDLDNTTGDISEKYGMNVLGPNSINTHDLTLSFHKK